MYKTAFLISVFILSAYLTGDVFGATKTPHFTADLKIGSSGVKVTDLQTFLIQNGFDIPAISKKGVAKGYYGFETSVAVARYQLREGVKATGYFGPLTRGKINLKYGSSLLPVSVSVQSTSTRKISTSTAKSVTPPKKAPIKKTPKPAPSPILVATSTKTVPIQTSPIIIVSPRISGKWTVGEEYEIQWRGDSSIGYSVYLLGSRTNKASNLTRKVIGADADVFTNIDTGIHSIFYTPTSTDVLKGNAEWSLLVCPANQPNSTKCGRANSLSVIPTPREESYALPSFEIFFPHAGAILETSSTYILSWSSLDRAPKYNVYIIGGQMGRLYIGTAFPRGTGGEFEWTIPSNFSVSNNYQIQFSVSGNSKAGGISSVFSIVNPHLQ